MKTNFNLFNPNFFLASAGKNIPKLKKGVSPLPQGIFEEF